MTDPRTTAEEKLERIANLKRYACALSSESLSFTECEDPTGQYVRWSDIADILKDTP